MDCVDTVEKEKLSFLQRIKPRTVRSKSRFANGHLATKGINETRNESTIEQNKAERWGW
jgi:hypothetical protein